MKIPDNVPCPECDGKLSHRQYLTSSIVAARCDQCSSLYFLGKDLIMVDSNTEMAYDTHFWEYLNAHR